MDADVRQSEHNARVWSGGRVCQGEAVPGSPQKRKPRPESNAGNATQGRVVLLDLLKERRRVPNEPGWALKEYGVACVFRKSEG